MINHFKKYLPILFILLIWFIFSIPYFLQGKVPYPSSYQVNAFPPWSAYSEFAGPVKNGAMPDVVTQIYPWRYFTIEQWKNGQIPLWNPYSFAGTPHLANYQSAVLSPLNIVFLILPFIDAWSLLILLQPLFAGLFMYLFVRSLKLSKISSLISAVSFMFCGFITVWMSYGTIAYAILFLPLSLWSIEKYLETKRIKYLLLLSITIPFSFFSGHFQTSIYFLLTVAAYSVYKCFFTTNFIVRSEERTTKQSQTFIRLPRFLSVARNDKSIKENTLKPNYKRFFILLCYIFFGLLLSLPQILPSIEFYALSVRSDIFQKMETIPWAYLPTLIAPDFYGNPVTRNDWFGHYAEWNAYIGVLPFIFALYSIVTGLILKEKNKLFFILLSIITLMLAFNTPLVDLLVNLRIPVLSTSAASRIIVIFSFSMAVLAAYGFEHLLDYIKHNNKKALLLWLGSIALLITMIWLVVFLKLLPDPSKVSIARNNLLLPTVISGVGLSIVVLSFIVKKKIPIAAIEIIILLLVSFDLFRFASKWQPFEARNYMFSKIPVSDYIEKISSENRGLGNYGAELSVYYRIPSLEGYDPVYIKRYGEFARFIEDGKLKDAERSVVRFPKSGEYTFDAINYLGVKYILHKASDDKAVWAFPYWNYPFEQFKVLFDDGRYRIYENKSSFPRAFLVGKYNVVKGPENILQTMFDKDTDLRKEVVLEEDVNISETDLSVNDAKIISYAPNTIDIETNSSADSVLLLTDNYYPGWKAFVDNNEEKIYRANYTFRSVVVPKGKHTVKFVYDPVSFRLGIYFSIAGLFGMIGVGMVMHKKYSNF